jgi:hypothetical protein
MRHAIQQWAGVVQWLVVLGLYSLLALLLTWPLAAHFTTHTTGDGIDDPALAWNLWWIKERLVTQANFDIFHVDWMFHPIQINLAFYTLTPLNGLLSTPLQSGLSLIVANNLLLLASFVLSAFGAYLLVLDQRQWVMSASHLPDSRTRWKLSALLAGVIYAFASSKLFYASLGQFNIASSQWIPFAMLYLLRMARPRQPGEVDGLERWNRIRSAAFAALFFGFQLYAELTYASFLLVFAAILFLWQIVFDRRRSLAAWLALLLPYLVFGIFIVIGMTPILWAMAPDMLTEGDFFASGGGFADIFSADLMGYFFPTILHPLWGDFAATLPFSNDKGQHIFLGYTVALLSALGLWFLASCRGTRTLAWLWGVLLLVFLLLTLGPTVRWGGEDTGIPAPFALISQLPFFSGNRYPSRYSVMLMATAAILSGFGLVWLLSRISAGGRWCSATPDARSPHRSGVFVSTTAIAALVLLEHLSISLPLNDLRIPPIHQRLAQEPNDFAILELPTGWRNGARVMGRSDVLIMMQQWWQTEHGKRRLGGNTSRNPIAKFQYFTEAPLLGELTALMNADRQHIGAYIDANYAGMVAAYRPRAAQILRDLGIRSVLLHEDKATPQLQRFVRDVLPLVEVDRWQGDDWTGAPASIVRYTLANETNTERIPTPRTISLIDEDASLYLGEGWAPLPTADGVRYATRRNPVLLVDLPATCAQIHLDWAGPAHTMGVRVNGQPLVLQSVAPDHLAAPLPVGVADQPVDRIELRFEGDSLPGGGVMTAPDGRGWSVGATGLTLPGASWLVVRSAGEEVGDFARIMVDGRDVARNERGYNLVALNSQGGVLDSVAFDTSGDSNASDALAAWIDRWPPGTVIAGAVNDEASLQLSQVAVDALHSLGVAANLRDHFRWSHAFIGATGARPGEAIETTALIRPATVVLGAPIDGEKVFGGLRAISIASCAR